MLVFDLSRPETFQSVLKVSPEQHACGDSGARCAVRTTSNALSWLQWKREIDSKVTLPNGSPLPVVLLANKCDLPDTKVEKDKLDAFCKEHGFTGWYETSAKNNHNIEEAVKGLVAACLSHPDAYEAQKLKSQQAAAAQQGTVSLADDKDEKKSDAKKGGCC